MLQIEDKDVPILLHLVDIRVVNLRDEEDVSTSNKADKDEDDDDEEDSPKVQALLLVSLYVDTVTCCAAVYTQASLTFCVSAALLGILEKINLLCIYCARRLPCDLSQAELMQLWLQ